MRSDCNARQVPRRPLPEGTSSSDGGGVEGKRLAVMRGGRCTSHESADGSNMLAQQQETCIKRRKSRFIEGQSIVGSVVVG